jgi:hypothetical protein
MPTKEELRTATLLDRGLKRTQDPSTRQHRVELNAVDKTPLMLYTEQITGQRIEQILLMQMSTWKLATWLSKQLGKPITQACIHKWRRRFNIKRERKETWDKHLQASREGSNESN